MSAKDNLIKVSTNSQATNWEILKAIDTFGAEVRSATLREAADTADRMAFEMRNCEDGMWPEEWSSREVRDAVQSVGGELRRMAEGEHNEDREEMPGMWERSDLSGGWADSEGR